MGNRSILVIDDEDSIREIVKACLEDVGGWQTMTASSGQAGIALATHHPFDAILLDISMPDMDGFSIFKALQEQNIFPQTPVILLTAKVLPADRQKFLEMPVTGIITKPFDPLELSSQIAVLLHWT